MKHLHHSTSGTSFRERRLLAFAEGAGKQAESSKKVESGEPKLDLQKKNEDLQQKLNKALEELAQLKNVQQRKTETTRAVLAKPVGQYDQRSTVNARGGVSSYPQYRSSFDAALGKSSYYPNYYLEGANIVAEQTPKGALNFYKPGQSLTRYDRTLGKIEFRMDSNGQWAVMNNVSVADMESRHEELQRADRARQLARQMRDTMLQQNLNRARNGGGQPLPADMEQDFAQQIYLEQMAKPGGKIDPNYNPNWTSNYKVAGQMMNSPAQVAKRKAELDAYKRDLARKNEEFFAKIDRIRKGDYSDVPQYQDQTPPSGGIPDSYQERFDRMRPNPQDKTASVDSAPFRTASASREVSRESYSNMVDSPPIEFDANRRLNIQRLRYRAGLDLNNSFDGRGGEGFRVKIMIPKEIVGGNNDESITYYPAGGRFRTNEDAMLANKAKVKIAIDKQNGDVIIGYGRDGQFAAWTEAGGTNSNTYKTEKETITVKTSFDAIPADVAAKEEAKYQDALALPEGTWGKIASGTKGSRGLDYAYRMTGGVLQAYSPIDGLFQFDRPTARWFTTGKPSRQLDVAYNAIKGVTPAPDATAKTDDPPGADKKPEGATSPDAESKKKSDGTTRA